MESCVARFWENWKKAIVPWLKCARNAQWWQKSFWSQQRFYCLGNSCVKNRVRHVRKPAL